VGGRVEKKKKERELDGCRKEGRIRKEAYEGDVAVGSIVHLKNSAFSPHPVCVTYSGGSLAWAK
jgi:hypothetical protein